MRTELFIKSRTYMDKLVEIEKKRIALEKEFQKILSAWNNITRHDAIPSLRPWPVISKNDFFKAISASRYDRYGMVFFILNTLYGISDSAYFYCYCHEKKSFGKSDMLCLKISVKVSRIGFRVSASLYFR